MTRAHYISLSTQTPTSTPVHSAAVVISGASLMLSLKRKRSIDEDDLDIASALTGTQLTPDRDDDDDELGDFIQDAIAKRNVKGGTDLLKKINNKKSKNGDVGGGSFQSMGQFNTQSLSILSLVRQVSTHVYCVRSHFGVTAHQPQFSAQPSPPFSPLPHAISSAWLAQVRERHSHT